ncbi:STN domain-containing protein [Alcaligenes phenolicus]|uniref:STN domain-containing protein n=1 Tax=Alcaligenes phenolicus TaxID=232846 RepID=UPI002AA8F311|nr:STN domain-containing protein [Alcaligenes phenolicus]
MTMTQVAISVAVLLGAFLLFACASLAVARSDADTLLNSSERLSFDIQAQPLAQALKAYGQRSDLSVLLDGADPQRPMPAVRGEMTRKQALSSLLHGSGLQAYYVDNRSIVIRLPDSRPGKAATGQRPLNLSHISGVRDGAHDYSAYVTRVQRTVRNALCRSPQTRPGAYRLAMQLWLNPQGQVERVHLLGSTGQASRDQAISQVLDSLAMGVAPDASLPQPLVLLLAPVSGHVRDDCPAQAGK